MHKLVIADDEKAVRNLLKTDIDWAAYGFELCGEAACGEEALKLVKDIKPHLLIVDIRMDGMSGLEVLKRVKQDCPETLVVMLSAYDSFAYAQEAILYSATGYLLKPPDPERLSAVLHKVRALLGDKRAGTEEPARENSFELACRYMQQHFSEGLTLEYVAALSYVHPSHLSRLFRTQMDTSFLDYLTALRLTKAEELLKYSNYRIREISELCGYEDYSYFSRLFHKKKGVTPLEYRCQYRKDSL